MKRKEKSNKPNKIFISFDSAIAAAAASAPLETSPFMVGAKDWREAWRTSPGRNKADDGDDDGALLS
uniref:Uncharacterized protein n=1 Tax=Caenorhabditis japonica TaxID=281687 RepID=A0A8R1EQA5_CAEJA